MSCTLEYCSAINFVNKNDDRSTYAQRKLPWIPNLFTGDNEDGILGANQGTITEGPFRKFQNAGLCDRIISSSIIQTGIGRIEYIFSNSWMEDILCGSRFAPELVCNGSSSKENSYLGERRNVLDYVILFEEILINLSYIFEMDTAFCSQALKICVPSCSSDKILSSTVPIYVVFSELHPKSIQHPNVYTTDSVPLSAFKRPVPCTNEFFKITVEENNFHSPNVYLSETAAHGEFGIMCDSELYRKKPLKKNQAGDHTHMNLHRPFQPECLVDVNIEVNKPQATKNFSGTQKGENDIPIKAIDSKKEKLETNSFPETKSTASNKNILQLEMNVLSKKPVLEKYLTQVKQVESETCGLSDKTTGICQITEDELPAREDSVFDAVNHKTERTAKSPMAQTAESTSVAPPVTSDAENVSSSADCSYSASICSQLERAPHEGERYLGVNLTSRAFLISSHFEFLQIGPKTCKHKYRRVFQSSFIETPRTSTYDAKLDDDEEDDSTYKRMTVRALLKKYERLTDELKRTNRTIDMLFLRRHAQGLSKSDTKSKTHLRNRKSRGCEWVDSKSTESTTTISQPSEEQHNEQDGCTKKVQQDPYLHPVSNRYEFMPNESKLHIGMMQYPEVLQSSNDQFAHRNSAPTQDGVIYSHNSGPILMEGFAMPPNYHQAYAPECMDYSNDGHPSFPQNLFGMTFVPPVAPNTMPTNRYFRGCHRDGQSISRQSTGNSVKCFTSSSRSRSAHHSGHHSRHRTASRRKNRSHRPKHPSYFQKQTHAPHHHTHHHRAKSHCPPLSNVKCIHQNPLNSFVTDSTQYCMHPECPGHCGTHSIPYASLPSSFASAAPGGIYAQPIPLPTPFGPSLPPNTANWSYAPWPMAHVPLHAEQPHYYWPHTLPPPPSSNNFGLMENELFKNATNYSEAQQSSEIPLPNRSEYSVLPDTHSNKVRQTSPCTNKSVPSKPEPLKQYNISENQPPLQTPPFKPYEAPNSPNQLVSRSGATMEPTVPDLVQVPAAFTGRTIPRSPVQRIQGNQPSTKQTPILVERFMNEHDVTKNQIGFTSGTPERLSKLLTVPSNMCGDHSGAKDKGLMYDSNGRDRMQLAEIPTKLANKIMIPTKMTNAIQCPDIDSDTRTLDWANSVSKIWMESKMQSTGSLDKPTECKLPQKQPQTAQSAIVSRANLTAEPVTPEEWKNVELRYDYLQKQKMILEGQISRLPKQSSVNKFSVKKEEEILMSHLTPIDRELSALRLLMRKRCSQARTMIKMKH
ncbi:hypothetical protein FGIG_02095 [Fasciola gigantica]|uniref:Uncharacterized protein n=1 Tax=Fasciola gigantica TaxID=46835 RepID=A0A504YJN3_FASGI|nr:hypothetical protein FGIG_02095 [Fasciola gigantica]